ncbi:MAG: ArsR family transcriptional regulator [Thermoplasmatales archaeon]|nr:MAG: ArsR family transcriptional regulator [Thermoplasmatales archaeon]
MKRKNMLVLDEKDEKAVEIFKELGMPKNLAKTLLYINQVDEFRSADVEQAADMRQPEVCIAIKELRRRGWVTKRDLKKEGKGRPIHIYTSTQNLSEILTDFEQKKLEEVETIKNDITELKNLINNR